MKSSQLWDMSSMQLSRNSWASVPSSVCSGGSTFHSTSRISLSIANSSDPIIESLADISR